VVKWSAVWREVVSRVARSGQPDVVLINESTLTQSCTKS
jgi:hypothetical protein